MKRTKLFRLLSLCLVAACLLSVAAALSFDKNNDGKTNVWDLQLAINEGDDSYDMNAALEEILGGPNEMQPNAEGVYEIWSAFGLYHMTQSNTAGKTYALMQDIDMAGRYWSPTENFAGTFDGGNFTVSNLNIKGSAENVGLFANMQAGATVKDLTLENVTVMASGNAKFVGVIAGTNAGTITNVNVIGTIADSRESADGVCYGVLAGKCEATGVITGGTAVSVTDGAEKYTTADLCADIKIITAATNAKKGVAAQIEEGATVTGTFCESTNATSLLSTAEQTMRETVIQNMYEQGTVKWTTSETVYYTKNDSSETIHSNAYVAGRTYTGIPYNHGAGSMERFLSQMQTQKDSSDRYVTKTGLENANYDNTGSVTTNTGFAQYMGTDCSSAISWAWAAVSSGRCEQDYGGVFLHTCRYMVPNAYNQRNYGIQAAGGYQLPVSDTEAFPDGKDVRNTREIVTLNGAQAMAEAYAKVHRGDALVFNTTKEEDFSNDEGHARLLAEDPVIIRNADGIIDLNKSYVITHEQGDGLGDKKDQNGNYISAYETTYRRDDTTGILPDKYNIKYTSWRINHKYTLAVLLTEEGYTAAKTAYNDGDATQKPGCGWGYVPITMRAFTEAKKTPYINTYTETHPVIAPNTGWLYSNYRSISVTLVVKDANGNDVYNETRFTGVGPTGTDYRSNGLNIKLENLFPDAVDGCVAGQTYTYQITLHYSNGDSKTYTPSAAYTHPAA